VPGSCAVIGFDDIRLASMVSPPLTTIRVDKYALGRHAMQHLLQMLDDPASSVPPVHVPVELVVRQST
jgi:DNA-binding LacI/PurR family transcriptional regulator